MVKMNFRILSLTVVVAILMMPLVAKAENQIITKQDPCGRVDLFEQNINNEYHNRLEQVHHNRRQAQSQLQKQRLEADKKWRQNRNFMEASWSTQISRLQPNPAEGSHQAVVKRYHQKVGSALFATQSNYEAIIGSIRQEIDKLIGRKHQKIDQTADELKNNLALTLSQAKNTCSDPEVTRQIIRDQIKAARLVYTSKITTINSEYGELTKISSKKQNDINKAREQLANILQASDDELKASQ